MRSTAGCAPLSATAAPTWPLPVDRASAAIPHLESVLKEAADRITDRLILISWGAPAQAPPELRALMEGYRGFADAITAEWLRRGRLPRGVVHHLLVEALLTLVDDVLPRIRTGREGSGPAARSDARPVFAGDTAAVFADGTAAVFAVTQPLSL